jgi:hypothetical protein
MLFDETEFPFSKLHPNAGARLREEISLLPQNLINLSESEQLNDHVANLPDESDIFCGRFDANRAPNAAHMSTGATGQENMPLGADLPARSASRSGSPASQDATPAAAATLHSLQCEPATSPTAVPVVSPPVSAAGEGGMPTASALPQAQQAGSSADIHAADDLPQGAVQQRPKTRLRSGIRKPKVYIDGTVKYGRFTSSGEPRNLDEALHDKNWKEAMDFEYTALMKNKTWHLVPP